MRFEGKVLFTTGAGSGLAEAVSRRFSAEGGRVAVLDLDGAKAEAVAAELEGSIWLQLDVADEESVAAAVATTTSELGRIDCVFNAAGHADFGPIEEWSLERWNRMLGVHAGGTFLCCKHTLPHLRAAGGGSIVNVASIAAITAQPFNAPVWRREGRDRRVHAPALARRRSRHPRQRRRTRPDQDRDDDAALHRARWGRLREGRGTRDPGHPDGEDR